MRALVVGGGPAGTTAAIALARAGIEALVVEHEETDRPVGIGLALQNSPLRALHALGLLDAVVDRGYRHDAVNICAPDGTVVHRIVTEPLVPGTPSFVAISRVALAGILGEALAATAGAQIRYGTSVTALRDRGDAVEADLTDGSTEVVDLVVGADGLHSTVRGMVLPEAPAPTPAPQVIWRASAPRPADVDRYLLYDLGPQGRVGIVPIADDELYLWFLQPDDGAARLPAELRLPALRARLAPFGGVVADVAALLRDDVDQRSLAALLVPQPWHRGRTVLIGDAAHTTTPHIAYGVGIAIEDSVVLAEELARGGSVEDALQAFTRRRFDRCRLVVETSLQLSAWEVDPPEDPTLHHQLSGRALGALSQPF
ncbi:FAD-dependent monooxygenase [Petropleomorpha daqingensis]|uniref:2-polyprenyl-6-methoxyphenol hydroxylase-like FAD-dependent oxidoreductase n=1 Tax=Petropleomorpha daqingensis TaxID=2026353 RepID=A0A853CKK2_9ACTN|nr:FAD-dependent monooxygenase [Petropleomorpha daqingensis]NYJ08455.1 2-polyprenyl-6-methoxyphenol hydroxylase-like FAD-dependent oxidoreductase [Petropleomorpha daqingensis]